MNSPTWRYLGSALAALLAVVALGCGGGSGDGPFAQLRSPAPSPTVAPSPTPEPTSTPATATPAPTSSPRASPSPTALRSPTPAGTSSAPSASPATRACDDVSAVRRVRPSVVRIDTATGMGTGVVATSSGLFITADHVVEDVQSARLTLADGRTVTAQVIARRPDLDLAALRADVTGLTAATWGDERALQPAQTLLALGFALNIPGEPSVTAGRFSAHRTQAGVTLVQTDAALNHGNSGGPVFTQCGDVVGIVSFGLAEAQGINFAVAASHARDLSANPASSARPSATARPATPRPATSSPSTGQSTGSPRQAIVIKRFGAALRASPASDARIVTIASCGTQLEVLGTQTGWVHVRDGRAGVEGWVGGIRVADAGSPPAYDCSNATTFQVNDTVISRVQTGCLSLRDQPARSGTILKCVENGTRYAIVNGPIEVDGEDWFQVSNPSLGTGWSLAQFLFSAR